MKRSKRGGVQYNTVIWIVVLGALGYSAYIWTPVAMRRISLGMTVGTIATEAISHQDNLQSWAQEQLEREYKNVGVLPQNVKELRVYTEGSGEDAKIEVVFTWYEPIRFFGIDMGRTFTVNESKAVWAGK